MHLNWNADFQAGEEIAQLQVAKAKAVQDEDYELADEIKVP
jgi:hypothetical protein